MKKLTIISFIFLSVQLFPQTQSVAFKNSLIEKSEFTADSLPPLSIPKIIFEGIGGVGLGYGLGYLIFKKMESSFDENSEGPHLMPYLGFLVGEILGSAIGVDLIGSLGSTKGNFLSTFYGALFGTILGVGLSEQVKSPLPFILFPTAGAVFLFNKDREYDEDYCSNSAMIQLQNENIQLGIPKIFLTRVDKTSNKLRYNFELLRVIF